METKQKKLKMELDGCGKASRLGNGGGWSVRKEMMCLGQNAHTHPHPHTHTHTNTHTHTHTHTPASAQPSPASAGSENEIFQAAISAANSITQGTCTKSCDFPDGEIGKGWWQKTVNNRGMAAEGQVRAQKQ